jgi:hypothetical protein
MCSNAKSAREGDVKPGKRVSAVLLILVSAAVLTAGCGGGDDEASSTAADTTRSATTPTTHTNGDWATVFSNPDAYKGDPVRLVGRVLSVERDKDFVTLQVYMAKNSEQNTVVTYKNSGQELDYDVFDRIYVRITGRVKGKVEGRNLVGDILKLPVVRASSVMVVDALEAATPAHTTYGPASSVKGGIRVTVRKIEAAPDETRVFVTVHNQSVADFDFPWDYISELFADGREIESANSFDHDYPRPASDVLAGSRTSGVLVFEPVPQDAALRLLLEGESDNSDVGDFGFLEWTFSW